MGVPGLLLGARRVPFFHDDASVFGQSGTAVALSGPTSSAIAVVAEGDALSDPITGNEHERERPELLRSLACPGDLGDPRAYRIQIRGDLMLPAHRSHMIAIVSPE